MSDNRYYVKSTGGRLNTVRAAGRLAICIQEPANLNRQFKLPSADWQTTGNHHSGIPLIIPRAILI